MAAEAEAVEEAEEGGVERSKSQKHLMLTTMPEVTANGWNQR
jgi:hypothetical protein